MPHLANVHVAVAGNLESAGLRLGGLDVKFEHRPLKGGCMCWHVWHRPSLHGIPPLVSPGFGTLEASQRLELLKIHAVWSSKS